MRTHRLPTLIVASLALVPLTLVAQPAAGHDTDREKFRAKLEPVNQPEARGRVKLRLEDGKLRVRLRARDLDDGIHVAHIHGIRQAENECPDGSFDTDDNGLVDVGEGVPAYGPIQLTLSDGLNDTGERIRYRRHFRMLDDDDKISALGDLSQYAIVVHGVDLDGDGMATNPDADGDGPTQAADNEISMPALCGTIEHHD